MSRRGLLKAGLLLMVLASGVVWLMWPPAMLLPADSKQDGMAGMEMPGMAQPRERSGVKSEKRDKKQDTKSRTSDASGPW